MILQSTFSHIECLYQACQSAITDGGLFRYTGVDKRGENERQSKKWLWDENRQDQGAREPTRVDAKD